MFWGCGEGGVGGAGCVEKWREREWVGAGWDMHVGVLSKTLSFCYTF